ncbi:guanylin-like [Pristis pectinata]|uniref:guanylin-like n=1 Tax=Pristis pectinata TaxID=685728 RepID=UPI00223CE184|nr:guanylin-like [Pristis pectinata]
MRTVWVSILLSTCLQTLSGVIVVRLGVHDFPLDDVIHLKEVMDDEIFERPRFTYMGTRSFCNNTNLPEVFKPICTKGDAPQVFYTLRQIATNPYPCTICAYIACVGCS